MPLGRWRDSHSSVLNLKFPVFKGIYSLRINQCLQFIDWPLLLADITHWSQHLVYLSQEADSSQGSTLLISLAWVLSCLVLSDSSQPRGPWPARLLCPWDSRGRNTGVSCQSLFQHPPHPGVKPILLHLLHWQADSLPLHHLGSPIK